MEARLSHRAESTSTFTEKSRAPPGINCHLVGKGRHRCTLPGSDTVQVGYLHEVIDAVLVKGVGVRFSMTVSKWTINFQNLSTSL
ncbi:hypothetical protein PAMP_002460 [Pampus punctatissimus]